MKAILYRNIVILVYVLLLPLLGYAQRAGDLDRSFDYGRGANYQFNKGYGANGEVQATALQADGKILIGGEFTSFNGIARNYIARLNADGSLDAYFNLGTGANNTVSTIALQADGKIIIGGEFTTYNGTTRNCIARLNADGTLDASFNPGTGANTNNGVFTTALQSDGKIIIGGIFTTFNGTRINRIARLNADGSLDASFNPGTGANNMVRTTALQADGKIIIGGSFTSFYGASRNYIARMNTDGSLDATFNPGTGATDYVISIAVQADGKIIIGGGFTSFNRTNRNQIARLNADGSLDATFNPGTRANSWVYTTAVQADGKIIIGGGADRGISRLNTDGTLDASFNPSGGVHGSVFTIALQTDGKIIIGGDFNSYNNTSRNCIARLNADGSLNATYNLSTGANNWVRTIAVLANGKIIIGGQFTSYNGTVRNRIARLNADGSLDVNFNPGIGANVIFWTTALQADGKIIIAGLFTSSFNSPRSYLARLNADGSLDPTFNPGTGVNGNISTIVVQADGKIIIGGSFDSYNGTERNCIARLNADGTLDASFNPGTGSNGDIKTIAVQANGKVIIGGVFTTYNGSTRNRIARLNADGSLDGTFNPGTGASNEIETIALQANGKVIIGGAFYSYNNTSRNRIARLNADGSLDPTFNIGTGAGDAYPYVYTISVQSDGKIIIGGSFISFNGTPRNRIARLNADGSLDATFNPGIGANNSVYTTTLQPDGNIIIGGDFRGYNNLSSPGIARIYGNCLVTPTISGDTTICSSTSTRLTSSSPTGNLWSTGDTTQFINVSQAGSYSVRVINGGCTSETSAPFRVVNAGPSPTVINFDTTSNLCLGARLQLTPAGTFNYYQWNTGERTRSIYTRTSGQYSVQVANSDSCFGLPSPPIFIAFDTNWCSVEIFRVGIDSITANVWADYYIWYLDGIELLSSNTLKTIPVQGDGVYTFRAVVGGRTSPLSNPIVITSARKSLVTKFEVYPNPATNKVTVNTSGSGTLEILNTLGQVVISQPTIETNELNITHLAKGVYTVRFNGASRMLVVK